MDNRTTYIEVGRLLAEEIKRLQRQLAEAKDAGADAVELAFIKTAIMRVQAAQFAIGDVVDCLGRLLSPTAHA